MPAHPQISVVLTTHNRLGLLPRAIASVLAQDDVDFELIIVDDCSTDGTSSYLGTLTDPRIRVLATARNSGAAVARNAGLNVARADIFAATTSISRIGCRHRFEFLRGIRMSLHFVLGH